MSFFGKRTGPLSSKPSPSLEHRPTEENVAANKLIQAKKSINATGARSLASAGTTLSATGSAAYWTVVGGLSAANLAAASAVGVGLAIPALAPATLGVIVACIFVMRQRGLNKELLSNLYFIQMEVERMSRVHSVMEVIAEEKGINLNTSSLAGCMETLKNKILKFADKNTERDIEKLQYFLANENIKEAQSLVETATEEGDRAVTRDIETQLEVGTKHLAGEQPQAGEEPQDGGGWSISGWASRWLSPDETLRQIIRDITIATVWFSIMLGEFDIFIKYARIIQKEQNETDDWIHSAQMQKLLQANKQLGLMTGKYKETDTQFDLFYNTNNIKDAAASLKISVNIIIEEKNIKGVNGTTTPTPPSGGRHTRKNRKIQYQT